MKFINIIGPTASGKTDLALHIAEKLPVSIINVDSALIYRGMDIGTAKPEKKILEQVPHYLIDICDPADSYSAANFAEDASRIMQEIHNQNRIPLLVGGTMLYFKALMQGLSDLPTADPDIRAQLEKEIKLHGLESLHKKLTELDPVAAKRIHPNDPQRLQRALEVCYLTGKPLSDSWQSKQTYIQPGWQSLTIALYPNDRARLHKQIEIRFKQMLAAGFIDEVKKLYAQDSFDPNKPAMRAVGYRQAWQYLAGEIDYETMVEKSIVATRQLAKRQLTWLKSWPDIDLQVDPYVSDIKAESQNFIKFFLSN